MRVGRSQSIPRANNKWPVVRGAMRVRTLDESLHSTYGSGSDDERKTEERRIEFLNIEIREYCRGIGDNPSCSAGPPMTITWDYDPNTQVLAVEEYENNRPRRRTQGEMVLPRKLRQEMLKREWGVAQSEIAAAVRTIIRTKNQRRNTVNNLGKSDKFEEMVEGATKQLLKTMFLRKSTKATVDKLNKQHDKADRQRREIMAISHSASL